MFDLKVCTVCLQMNVKCYNLNTNSQLRMDFNLISGLQNCNRNGLPEYLCYLCTAYVQSCKRFRDKCQRAYCVLTEVLKRNKQITKPIIEEIDCNALKIGPTLSFLDNERVKTKHNNVKKWMQECRTSIEQDKSIPGEQQGRFIDKLVFENQPLTSIKAENTGSTDSVALTKEECHDDTENTNAIDLLDQDFVAMDQDFDIDEDGQEIGPIVTTNADESKLNVDYAIMVPLSVREAKAVVELNDLITNNQGRHKCEVCKRCFQSDKRLQMHMRMHDKHVSGTWQCELCNYYYKTEFLLRTHITDKHMYKYLCKMCPEVTFDRLLAKRHYMWTHVHKRRSRLDLKNHAKGTQARAKWLCTKNVKKEIKPVKRKTRKHPDDYLIYSPISQEEQYALVRDRQNTKNFKESPFTCEFCFKGFREIVTYTKHMQKHDPAVSGRLQCDMCKIYCPSARKMYKHMNITHLFKYTCQVCAFVCYNRGQAMMHYRYHKNVTYSCEQCNKVFTKASTRLTHIRIKHPSTFICNMCGHSFVSETGLHCHKRLAHKQEMEEAAGEKVTSVVDTSDPLYCAECQIQFRDDAAFATHFGSSNKHADTNLSIKPVRTKSERGRGRPRARRDRRGDIVNNGLATGSNCEICQKFLASDVQARKHYEAEHPGAEYLKRYMCDICGHTTKQYANLTVHMRTHTQEKPYACPHCERRFSMPSNRDRHLVVHTGEKRYQCQHCNRRFTQSSAVKLHIQTVHLKIPYAPWDKKNRKRRRDAEVAPLPPPPPAQRILLDAGNYLSAYITYNE